MAVDSGSCRATASKMGKRGSDETILRLINPHQHLGIAVTERDERLGVCFDRHLEVEIAANRRKAGATNEGLAMSAGCVGKQVILWEWRDSETEKDPDADCNLSGPKSAYLERE